MPKCEICAKANISRIPFPSVSHTRASRLLFRMHTDICGPLPLGYGGFKYFLLLVDDYSRYILIAFLKSRGEAPEKLIALVKAAENFLGVKLSVLRVDNAPEYVEGRLKQWCAENGVTFEKIVPDASPQNGVAERANRTIACITRAFLLDGKLSDYFWPFAAQAGVHVKNRVPHSAIPPEITPFFIWRDRKPNLSHLRPFGCKVTTRRLDSDSINKLTPRGEEGIFLGYAQDAKGYLIWNPQSRNVRVRRDVIFHDDTGDLDVPRASADQTLWDAVIGDGSVRGPETDGQMDQRSGDSARNAREIARDEQIIMPSWPVHEYVHKTISYPGTALN